jgi:type I restriction enzyme R subunit
MSHVPSTREDDASQIPALLLLQQLGYTYLTPPKALKERDHREAEVLLPSRLRTWLKNNNEFSYRGKQYPFTDDAISAAVEALRRPSLEKGYIATNQEIYDLLTLGFTVEQTIDGDKKSYTIQYLNWKPEKLDKNDFCVTEELSVQRSGRSDHYQPDIVLYVNGIPLVVIECKRPTLKKPIHQAISQHLRQQQPDGIRPLYLSAQILLAVAGEYGRDVPSATEDEGQEMRDPAYGTTGTLEEFWATWRHRAEDDPQDAPRRRAELQQLKNDSINQPTAWQQLLTNPERANQPHPYAASLGQPWAITPQDDLIYAICQPARLLDLIRNYILFDGGQKIVARYQQYYGVRETLRRAAHSQGGVLWHSQGSGKSLTMVMLAQLLAVQLPNAKIILVTDRVELDEQIYDTFKRCGREVVAASTGNKLAALLQDEYSTDIVATLIHKFNAAVKILQRDNTPVNRPDVFVLVDEGHRTQYGRLSAKMKLALPTATFIAFTGTPLTKSEKNTAREFGGLIHRYTITDAERDKTVLPILYEGRMPNFSTNDGPLNTFFNRLVARLPEEDQFRLREKYSSQSRLSHTAQVIFAKAFDISLHFSTTWQGQGFKGQIAAPSKLAAIRFKKALDDIGQVSSEVLISKPDDREGNDDVHDASTDEVLTFWRRMMDRFGTEAVYEKSLKDGFRAPYGSPDIIITVDKLLTGFDNPHNVVLYLCRRLKEHTLFQAIARVNRCSPNKEFGYVLDYEGVTKELQAAMVLYGNSDFDVYDLDDLSEGIRLAALATEVAQLPQLHANLVELFQEIPNQGDLAAYTSHLADESHRPIFFERLRAFQRVLHRALSSADYLDNTPDAQVDAYLRDLAFYANLRNMVIHRYSVEADYSKLEPQIQKLLDTHVSAADMIEVVPPINIFSDEFPALVAERVAPYGKGAENEEGVAYEIATQLVKTLTEKLDENPAKYQEFIDRIKESIRMYQQERRDAAELLKEVVVVREEFQSGASSTRPASLHGRQVASAVFDLLDKSLTNIAPDAVAQWAIQVEGTIYDTVHDHDGTRLVDWHKPGSKVLRKLRYELGEQLWALREHDTTLDEATLDDFERQLEGVAIANYKAS